MGSGLNVEQEIIKNVGAFARLGWSDGQNEAWVFADVDRTATLGLSIKGEFWHRPNDTSAWRECSTASRTSIRSSLRPAARASSPGTGT